MLTLKCWGNAWIEYTLNPKTLSHSRRLFHSQDRNSEIQGFATYESVFGIFKRFYAVYGFENRFYFQANKKRWDLTDGELDVNLIFIRNGIASIVKIYYNKELIHKAFFVHVFKGVFAMIDPAFDYIDAEDSYFFLFLNNQMPKATWRKHIISMEKNA